MPALANSLQMHSEWVLWPETMANHSKRPLNIRSEDARIS